MLTPRLSALWSHDHAAHRRVTRLGIASAAGLALLLSAFTLGTAPWLLDGIFGVTAVPAALALRLLAAGLIFVFVIWILHAVAISVFEERLLLTTTLVGSFVNIALNIAFIPRYGRDGAAAATVLGEFVTMTMLIWGLRRVLFARRTTS